MKRAYRAKTKRMRTAVKTAALMSLGVPLATMPAIAQDDEGELAPVVITGSNIPTVELEGPSPVVTIDREEINRSSAETVGELLRRLPQNNAGSYDEKFQNSFAPGSSGVSLRGLGMGYTLVLVDGRRVANYSMAQNQTATFTDLNGIPMSVIERVEVLLDGASAIYGSDAVAGVVNIITRKDFDGLQIDAGYSNSTHTDVGTQRYSITGGTTSENGSAWINLEYTQRNSSQMDDRPLSASANQVPNGGYDFRSSSGNPGSIKILPGSENGYESGFYQVPGDSTGTPTAEEIIAAPGINRFDYNPWMTLTPEAGRGGLPNRTGAGAGASGTRDLAAPFGQAQRQSPRTPVFPGLGRFASRIAFAACRRAERAAGDAHPLGQAPEIRRTRPGNRHQRHRFPAAHLHPGPVEKAVSPIRAWRPD